MSTDDVPSGAAHLDLGTLAELDEGLLPPAAADRARGHVERCGECTERLASVTGVRAALAAAPAEPLPAAVGARLDATLARAARERAAPPRRPARRVQWRPSGGLLASGAAASIVVLLFGALAISAIRDGAGRATNDAGMGGGGGRSAAQSSEPLGAGVDSADGGVTDSGRNYSAASLPEAVAGLLAGRPAAQPVPSAAPGEDASALSPGRLGRLADSGALGTCVTELAGRPSVRPLAVDFGSYAGRPAAVVVLPETGSPALLDVWVVGHGCTTGDPQLLYFTRLPRPAGMSAP